MRLNLSSLSVSLIIMGGASVIEAAQTMPLSQTSLSQLQKQFQLLLPNGIKSDTMLSKVGADEQLQFLQQHTDKNHISHVRMQQLYHGFPVYRGYAIVHSSQTATNLLKSSKPVKITGRLYTHLDSDLGMVSADFAQRGALALQHFKFPFQHDKLSEETVQPIVYIDKQNRAIWAYRVSVLVKYQDKIPKRPTAILDAHTFAPLKQWDEIKTAKAFGMGYAGNTLNPKKQYGKELPLLNITRNSLTKQCSMENDSVKVVDMEHSYNDEFKLTMKFPCQHGPKPSTYWTGYKGDGFDQVNGGYSASNDALFSGAIIEQMYKNWFNIPPLTANGKQMKLIMRVHYGIGYENAYWDGKQMTFGDGDAMFYPLVSLDISAHEISHGFTEQHSNLVYDEQSGGLNESFSDMAAVAAQYFSAGKNDWRIGAEILKKGSGMKALRFMDVPSKDGYSIDTADQYYEGINVHFSSGVYNRLFYLLATTPNWNTQKAFAVMVKANMDYWTPTVTFNEAACGVLSASQDLGFSVADVRNALDVVAINHSQCS